MKHYLMMQLRNYNADIPDVSQHNLNMMEQELLMGVQQNLEKG